MKQYCEYCNGTGQEPNGWTLAKAQANPEEFNKHRIKTNYGANSGVIDMMPHVVSPLYFKDGVERCHVCHGTGTTREWEEEQARIRAEKERNFFTDLLGAPGADKLEIPEGHQAIIIQAYFDDSDMMTDYYCPHRSIGPVFVLAYTKNKRQTEATIRKVLRRIPELNELDWEWHTENYSGGHGNYLRSEYIGSYEKEAYDGRQEVSFWYEISYTSGKWTTFYPSKWFGRTEKNTKKKTRKETATMEKSDGEVTYSKYKGHPIITLPDGSKKGFSFGVRKARAILEYYEEIKRFVEQNS